MVTEVLPAPDGPVLTLVGAGIALIAIASVGIRLVISRRFPVRAVTWRPLAVSGVGAYLIALGVHDPTPLQALSGCAGILGLAALIVNAPWLGHHMDRAQAVVFIALLGGQAILFAAGGLNDAVFEQIPVVFSFSLGIGLLLWSVELVIKRPRFDIAKLKRIRPRPPIVFGQKAREAEHSASRPYDPDGELVDETVTALPWPLSAIALAAVGGFLVVAAVPPSPLHADAERLREDLLPWWDTFVFAASALGVLVALLEREFAHFAVGAVFLGLVALLAPGVGVDFGW